MSDSITLRPSARVNAAARFLHGRFRLERAGSADADNYRPRGGAAYRKGVSDTGV